MKLSVISASFNVLSNCGARRLEESVRSVAALEVEHEHLIFDGASTDGTLEVLKRLESEIPSLKVVSEKDEGIYDALNKGAEIAKGDYLYVIGMDDEIIDPKAMEDAIRLMDMEKSDILVSQVVYEGDGKLRPKSLKSAYDSAFKLGYCHQGALVRRASIPGNKAFDESYRIAADYKQLLSLHYNGAKVTLFAKPFAMYSDQGVSTTAEVKLHEEYSRVHAEVYRLSAREKEDELRSGKIPLKVVLKLLSSGSSFSCIMGIKVLCSYLYRKHKDMTTSSYYLLSLPIYRHLKKTKK